VRVAWRAAISSLALALQREVLEFSTEAAEQIAGNKKFHQVR
jgi:hypothetical protein